MSLTKGGFAVGELPVETRLFINNEFVSGNGTQFNTVNPVNEEVIKSVDSANKADIDRAVAAATEAFRSWGKGNGCDRRDCLLRLASLVEKHRDQLAEIESLDNGKPKHVADSVDIGFVIECYRYYAGWSDKCGGKVIRPTRDSNNTFAYTVHEPIGVCGCIIPWNFPLLMQAWKLGPALAMGCTVVMKLSEKTPLTGLMMCHLIKEAGFPPGVVNVVNGYGNPTGDLITHHMDIKKVAFTGSSAVGHKIVVASGNSNLKKVSLELGGKSAMIICKDADLDQAAAACHVGLFINMGQCCCASSRIFIHEDVQDAFVAKVKALASTLRTQGDTISETFSPACDLGPQIDEIQFKKIMGYIEKGKKEGAKCVLGGSRVGEKGYFVAPTIFTGVQDKMVIAKEEIFGPVMQLMTFRTNEEVVERANNTVYGLAAGVCTRDVGQALSLASQLEAGTVWINSYDNFDMACPFGGYKESGWGSDKGEYALDNYTITKCVMLPVDMPKEKPPYPVSAS